MTSQKTVVILGAGNFAQYFASEFLLDGRYTTLVISRTPNPWFTKNANKPGLTYMQIPSYTKAAILPILNSNNAITAISTLQTADPDYYTQVHTAILEACKESKSCKRFIPSDYVGDSDKFPHVPRDQSASRSPFRRLLDEDAAEQADDDGGGGVETTTVSPGWLMDYFVQRADGSKSYIRAFPEGWPVDLEKGTYRVVGGGEVPVSWVATRDMAKAVVQLVEGPRWDRRTFVFGEMGNFNGAVEQLEGFLGRRFERITRTAEDIEEALSQTEDKEKRYTATIDEWTSLGATAVPYEKAMQQREKYFQNVHFRTIQELLEDSKRVDIV